MVLLAVVDVTKPGCYECGGGEKIWVKAGGFYEVCGEVVEIMACEGFWKAGEGGVDVVVVSEWRDTVEVGLKTRFVFN